MLVEELSPVLWDGGRRVWLAVVRAKSLVECQRSGNGARDENDQEDEENVYQCGLETDIQDAESDRFSDASAEY